MPSQTKEATFGYRPSTPEETAQRQLDALIWSSLVNHIHTVEGRGAHNPDVWEAYDSGHLTDEQRAELELRPGIDYVVLEVGLTGLIGASRSSEAAA